VRIMQNIVTNDTSSRPLNGEAAVAAKDLSIGYRGETVVDGINFAVARGRSLALVGTNGSGKSTLLKTVAGLLAPVRGRLLTLNRKPGAVPRSIAYLSQFHASGFILPLRAVEVVRMGRFPVRGLFGRMTAEDEALVADAMTAMGIVGLAGAPLWSLSGGQQQRIYIAQALAHRADLIILDEPTAGLDAAGQELYSQAIKAELARGAALVTATHDIEEAADCDQVMLLARRVIALGPGPEVLTPELLLKTFGIHIRHG
jgi:ABC-type Mn2+/Zn2+ transport system ATPase subunit